VTIDPNLIRGYVVTKTQSDSHANVLKMDDAGSGTRQEAIMLCRRSGRGVPLVEWSARRYRLHHAAHPIMPL
jgi:hypothetical protein